MRHTGAILMGAIFVGAFAAAAAGSASRVVRLPLHGTVILSGSNIRCGSGSLNGVTYIDCGVSDVSGQPKQGGYVALMAADGRVNVIRVTTKKTVFSRMPAAVVRTSAGTLVHPGDVIQLPGTSISCNVSSVGGKPTIICYYLDTRGVVRPHSYSFGISDTVVTALGWDAVRHAHLIHGWPENG